MIRYDLPVCIGRGNNGEPPQIKRLDTGVNIAVHLMVCKKVSQWREVSEPYYLLEGCTAVIRVHKPDDTAITTDKGLRFEAGNVVVFSFAEVPQASTAAGVCNAEIVLYDKAGERLTTATFTYEITQECVCGDESPSADYFDVLGEEIQRAKTAAETANKAAEKALGCSANPPRISKNMTWETWDPDTGCYVDTGVIAEGENYIITEADKQEIAGAVVESEEIQEVENTAAEALERAAVAEELAKGMNTAKGFDSYAAMIEELNDAPADAFKVGTSFYIITLGVPDLWVSGIEETNEPYTYVDDVTVVATLQSVGFVRVGHYRLSMLETLKQDLTNYVKNTDYATGAKGGVIKTVTSFGHAVNRDGFLIHQAPTKDIVDAKSHSQIPLTPHLLDYAVKVGLTTNTEALTAEEQAAAQSWLGGSMIKTIAADENGEFKCHILDMEDGIYYLPVNTMVQYRPTGATEKIYSTSMLIINTYAGGQKNFTILNRNYAAVCVGYENENNGTIMTAYLTYMAATNVANTFTKTQKMTAELAADDNSTNIPNTQWVNAAIEGGKGEVSEKLKVVSENGQTTEYFVDKITRTSAGGVSKTVNIPYDDGTLALNHKVAQLSGSNTFTGTNIFQGKLTFDYLPSTPDGTMATQAWVENQGYSTLGDWSVKNLTHPVGSVFVTYDTDKSPSDASLLGMGNWMKLQTLNFGGLIGNVDIGSNGMNMTDTSGTERRVRLWIRLPNA